MDGNLNEIQDKIDYLYQIYIPVAAWLVANIVLIVLLLKKYTFGHWTKDRPNPFENETLAMPKGTFRGILTLTLLYVVVVFELHNLRIGKETEDNFMEFLVAFKMMIAFYFGGKVASDFTTKPEKKKDESVIYENPTTETEITSTSTTSTGSESEFHDPESNG